MIDCNACRLLLMGLIDNELDGDEINDVNEHLLRCAGCREEYDQLSSAHKDLATVAFREPDDEVIERMWKSPFNKLTRWSGIVLVIAGYTALVAYGLYLFFSDSSEAFLPKIALAALIGGFSILLLSVLRERITTYSTDRYREVQR